MCSAEIRTGRILCENCEKPRQRRASPSAAAGDSVGSAPSVDGLAVMFEGAEIPAIILRGDSVEFVSSTVETALPSLATSSLEKLEKASGLELAHASDGIYDLNDTSRRLVLSTIGGGLRIVSFTPDRGETGSSLEFLREAVVLPLRSLGESLQAAHHQRGSDRILRDAAAAIEQALSTLELSAGLGSSEESEEESPTVAGVIDNVSARFQPLATQKKISLTVDVSSGGELVFSEPGALGESLATLVDNSLRYTPVGGQAVVGVREMEHKGTPILLFFVMDNGPVVPEEYREAIFSPGFAWDPAAAVRTGRDLAQCRKFAMRHGGKAWVDARTGRACTFYLSVAKP